MGDRPRPKAIRQTYALILVAVSRLSLQLARSDYIFGCLQRDRRRLQVDTYINM